VADKKAFWQHKSMFTHKSINIENGYVLVFTVYVNRLFDQVIWNPQHNYCGHFEVIQDILITDQHQYTDYKTIFKHL